MDDGRRTTDDGRRAMDDGRWTTDDERTTDGIILYQSWIGYHAADRVYKKKIYNEADRIHRNTVEIKRAGNNTYVPYVSMWFKTCGDTITGVRKILKALI